MKNSTVRTALLLALAAPVVIGFQNCSNDVNFNDPSNKQFAICNGVSCDLTPITTKPAVTTILLALGDSANSQLVINGASSQLIGETVIRYTSPKEDPRILLVRDHNSNGESPEDTTYVKDVLLARYDVTEIYEPSNGLTDNDLAGYDIVWHNNPGHAMGSVNTHDALLRFAGGIVIQGDDLAQGRGFSNEDLTGLKFVDNGTQVTCGSQTYGIDNNSGSQFAVSLDPNLMPAVDMSAISFFYGNDIDNTVATRPGLEVLATAKGSASECTETRPAIVRYVKQ